MLLRLRRCGIFFVLTNQNDAQRQPRSDFFSTIFINSIGTIGTIVPVIHIEMPVIAML